MLATDSTHLQQFEQVGEAMNNDHDVKTLNGLIETTIDSVEGYREAAKEAGSSNYSAMFLRRANEREAVVRQLRATVTSLGGKPEDDGTVLASAHRVFVDLRASMSKGDKAVIDEVERGEDHIKAKYESALKDQELTPTSRSLIQQAYTSVRSGHDEMRDLKHSLEGRA
jgi:uncharacterized protein (TIGR02284 family)